MRCKQNYLGGTLVLETIPRKDLLFNFLGIKIRVIQDYMLIEDRKIPVKIWGVNREHYEGIMNCSLKNGEEIMIEQKFLPFSSRNEVYFICDICQEEYVAKRNTQKEATHNTYCSKDCHKEGKRRSMNTNNPNPKNRIHVKCDTCGKDIETVPSVLKRQDAFTCSWECYQERRKNRGFNLLNKETVPERMMREYLEDEGIEYEIQKSVYPYWCDFYIPKENLIVEVFGNYWHANPRRYGHEGIEDKYAIIWEQDIKRINYIIEKGYRAVIVWEDTIHKNPKEAIDIVKSYLKN